MARLPKYYWDACVWIDLITQSDEDRFSRCDYVLSEVKENKAELWTSAFTLAEVYKRKCDDEFTSMPEDQEDEFLSLFDSGLVKIVLVDIQVAKVSRRLSRRYSGLRKPQDAIHVASCIIGNIDELHTFDVKDLIKLDGQITLENGNLLKISKPSLPPSDPQMELFSD